MVSFQDLNHINDYEWEIPTSFRKDMRVPVRLFANRKILEAALEDESITQAINSTTLPGLVGHVVVMPDIHQGYGFPIGTVAATALPDGAISPGGIGYDINCGVRLLASSIQFIEAESFLEDLVIALHQSCPSGVGSKGTQRLTKDELDLVCRLGAKWAHKKGFTSVEDLHRTEENGCVEGANPEKVSARAKERGLEQLGSLGAGNHFLEVGVIDQVFDPSAAQVMGIQQGCLTLMIHCGSRGLGHQICTDYVLEFQSAVKRNSIQLPDRELVCAPLNSHEGQNYLAAMRSAANYAFANRQLLAYSARHAFEIVLGGKVKNPYLHQVYDLAHNIGKIEIHNVAGHDLQVCVHRKGATRAFGPGSAGLPDEFSAIGQPVLVPGSMGTASWVLLGTHASMQRSFGSSCHGAGRLMSRSQAKRELRGEGILKELGKAGIHIRSGPLSALAEEAPQAYKDVDEVVEIVIAAGIARKVARLRPVAVVKG
jgi:tRNA-splicing ligase RtcB